MNRSVLLVICDFLILTLLSFVQFDVTPPQPVSEPALAHGASAPAMSNLLATLESALELEREQRDALTNALATASSELAERLRLLSDREQALTNLQQRLAHSETEGRQLAEQRSRLEREQAEATASVRELQRAFETVQRGADSLQDRLSDTTRDAAEAKARLGVLEDELGRRREEAQEMQRRIGELDTSRERLREEKLQLAGELRQTEAQAIIARSEVTNLTRQLVSSGVEKAQLLDTTARLATNVGALSEQSSAIREQIERQTRLPANTIYADYLTNRIRVEMMGTTRGGFGREVVRRSSNETVLVRSGEQVFALLHLESTPIRLWPIEAPWTAFSARLERAGHRSSAPEFALLSRDPRVAAVPVDAATVAELGARVYEVAKDPSQFADAVVIGGAEAYYGETAFRLSAGNPGYVEMERSTMRRLLGEFTPRRGDLAFTKTGELLGILVNSDHCLILDDLSMLPAFQCGTGLDSGRNTSILRSAQTVLERQSQALR